MKVIISDVGSRKAFDVVNIVQRLYGFSAILCAGKDYRVRLPLVYGQKVYPLRSGAYPLFEEDLKSLLTVFSGEQLVYLPVSERPTRHLYEYVRRHGRPDGLFYLLPTAEHFDLTSDKSRFQQYCEDNGFPVPASILIADALNGDLPFRPMILKPISGEGSVGIKHIDVPEDLAKLEGVNPENYVLQEKIISDRKVSGAFFLCREGKVISRYTHQRLRTFPANGGVTVFSRADHNREILDIGAKFLAALQWDGLAMIEFLYDPTAGQWKMIELNPRLWGSVLLSAFNDSGMLRHYVERSLGKSAAGNTDWLAVSIRWFYPFEVLNWLRGNISFKQLVTFNSKHTCYINFTYSSFYRSLAYFLYFTFNVSSIRRLQKKIA